MRMGGIDMNDKELLELAAKAAGYVVDSDFYRLVVRDNSGTPICWNPLEDDGDALRLAAKLLIDIGQFPSEVVAAVDIDDHPASFRLLFTEPVNNEEYRGESTRRAIVRAAARIGETQ